MEPKNDSIRLTSKQIEILRKLPDKELKKAFLILRQVSPADLNAKILINNLEVESNGLPDSIPFAEPDLSQKIASIHGLNEIFLDSQQIVALANLPAPHLRKALRLMKTVRQSDLNGLILQVQYAVTLEKEELSRLMTETVTNDKGRHTFQKPAQRDDEDIEA